MLVQDLAALKVPVKKVADHALCLSDNLQEIPCRPAKMCLLQLVTKCQAVLALRNAALALAATSRKPLQASRAFW